MSNVISFEPDHNKSSETMGMSGFPKGSGEIYGQCFQGYLDNLKAK